MIHIHNYFTPETIQSKARELLQAANESGRKPPLAFNPHRSALLVLDMQEYFLDPASHAFIPSAAAILPGIQHLIDAYAQYSRPIIFTRHLNTPQDAKSMGRWWRDLIDVQSPFSQISALLDTTKGRLLHKSQYDAFYHTNLGKILNGHGIQQVVITGVMTHLCCETTARSAFVRGYDVFFTVDGTASYNEAFHRAALTNLAHGFATLVLVEDLLAAFSSGQFE